MELAAYRKVTQEIHQIWDVEDGTGTTMFVFLAQKTGSSILTVIVWPSMINALSSTKLELV